MKLDDYIKKLVLPDDFIAPKKLEFENLAARPLARKDLKPDLEAVNNSRELIRKTRGISWPEGEIDKDEDLLDLAWHEREFKHNDSFAYVVYGSDGKYVGCFYLYQMGVRTRLNEELKDFDVDASWWVTNEAYKKGDYERLFKGLKIWLDSEFPFEKPYFSNLEIPSL